MAKKANNFSGLLNSIGTKKSWYGKGQCRSENCGKHNNNRRMGAILVKTRANTSHRGRSTY